MKKILFFMLMLVLFTSACSKKKEKSALIYKEVKTMEKARIVASNGVVLREKPGVQHKKIGTVLNYNEVEILDENGPIEIINDNAAAWIKIRFEGKDGWIFGAYAEKNTDHGWVGFTHNLDYFAEFGFNLPIKWTMTKDELIKVFGVPLNIVQDSFVSPQTNEKHPLSILQYRDFSVDVVTGVNKSFVMLIEVKKSFKPMLFGLKINDGVEKFQKVLGKSEAKSDCEEDWAKGKTVDVYTYIANEGYRSVDIYVYQEKVIRVIWKVILD